MTQTKHTEKSGSEPEEPAGAGCWWTRNDLYYAPDGQLFFGNTPLSRFVRHNPALTHGANHCVDDLPLYVYNLGRIRAKVAMIRAAMPEASILYAVKANRHPEILATLRPLVDGIDICSPNEAQLALQHGFRPEQLSYTGTSMSDGDLRFLATFPQIHVNADSLSQLRRLVRVRPNQPIGVRINPEQGIGYRNEKRLVYAQSQQPSKFGLLREQLAEAVVIAAECGCRIDTVHWHVGCGWLSPQLPALFQIIDTALEMTAQLPDVSHLNLGGGLGIPFRADDQPLPIGDWAAGVRQCLAKSAGRYSVTIEPGAFLVQDAGILLTKVNTVETKRDWTFVGVQAGFNLLMEPVFYHIPCEPVFLQLPEKSRETRSITIAGNINEAHDMLIQDFSMPVPQEGEWIGFLNAGAYGAAMSSNHCLRGDFREMTIDDY